LAGVAARRGKSGGRGLSGWLGSLSEQELTELLAARPDVLTSPPPHSLGELAGRLGTVYAVRATVGALTAAGLALLEAVLVLDEQADQPRLHELLGGPSVLPAERLAEELAQLLRLGLVWPDGQRLASPGVLRQLIPTPLCTGRPARPLLGRLTVDQLRRIGEAHALRGLPNKSAWVDALTAALSDPEAVRALLAQLSPEARELADEVAWHGPAVGGVHLPTEGSRIPRTAGTELALLGWLIPEAWTTVAEMPREVAFAVRGPDYHLTLPPPPALAIGAPADPERLRAAGQRAAGSATDGLNRLLGWLAHTPLATVRSGGVGVRELRRAGKALGVDEDRVRLWVETAAAAGLITMEDGGLLPTPAGEAWRHAEPAPAWAGMVTAWWELPVTPTHRIDEDGKAQPALGGRLTGPDGGGLRADLLNVYADAGRGTPVPNFPGVIERLAWRRPVVYGDADELTPHAAAARAEAQALGLLADDALTPHGTALLTAARNGELPKGLAGAVAGLLPRPVGTATFLPDLTAVVGGAASAELAALLDGCADAETRDVASTWRFSPSSVRRALDDGHTADVLLRDLSAVADKPLPQALSYLVGDVARRHGQVRVRAVSCCVCVPDPALAAEIAGTRSLAGLTLAVLADTVLGSPKSVAETLAALRKAGYAPVREDAQGRTVVERVPARRARTPRRRAPNAPFRAAPPMPLDPARLAATLHRAGRPTEPTEPLFPL
jgi:hypothetical protein